MRAAALFKKLKVVDEQDLLRLIEKQLRQYDPALHAMAGMKQEMDSALLREDLSPEEKLTLFKVNQQRFSQMKPTATLASPVEIAGPAPRHPGQFVQHDAADVESEYENLPKSDFHRTDSISSALNFQATDADADPSASASAAAGIGLVEGLHAKQIAAFEKLLKKSENFIKSNPDNGELMVEGKTIPGSSFHDLVYSLFEKKKAANLKGQESFLEIIRDLAQNRTNGWPDLAELSKLIPRTSILKVLKAEPMSPASASTNSVFTRAARSKYLEHKGKGKGRLISKRGGVQFGPPGKRIKVMYLY